MSKTAILLEESKPPSQTAKPQEKLLSLAFLLLFFQATCCNCYIAVFYCMEQWMARIAIAPSTRGLLLAVMAIVLFLSRPAITWLLYGRKKTSSMVLAIVVSSLTLTAYPFIPLEHAVGAIFLLRACQGFFLAIYSSATISLLVDCIPKGQSARGFAIFPSRFSFPLPFFQPLAKNFLFWLAAKPNSLPQQPCSAFQPWQRSPSFETNSMPRPYPIRRNATTEPSCGKASA